MAGESDYCRRFVEALLYGERVRRSYDLYAWVVMPNHVHVALKPHHKLPEIVRWVKTATAVRGVTTPVFGLGARIILVFS